MSSGKGVFAVEETMPCEPGVLRTGNYLVGVFGRVEQEEAAARVVSFSAKEGRWVGVSWTLIAQEMKQELFRDRELEQQRSKQRAIWFNQMDRHFWLCFFTLGIYGLFVPKPGYPNDGLERRAATKATPSGICSCGPQYVLAGIRELLEQGMLKSVAIPQEEDGRVVEVIFPTSALVQKIMEAQCPIGGHN